MSMKFPTVPSKRLAESINGSATSFKVSDLEGWDGADISSSTFGTELYVVFRNSANTLMEIMKVDPATITTAASAITISLRGLKFDGDLATEVSANKLTWVKGDTIVEFGSNPGQIFQWLKEYIDGIAIAGSPDASITAKGLVEEATYADIIARTGAGSTAARLFLNPSTIPSTLLSDYKADTGAADAYVITPSPAITAYTVGQTFSFKATNTNTTSSTINVNGLGVKTIKKGDGATNLSAGDIVAGQIVTIEYDGTFFQMLSPVGNAPVPLSYLRDGGTGADGALTVSSGTTSIDLGSAAVVVKNYTSISITGTGAIAFTNPHANGTTIIFKSQGAVTITSSSSSVIDLRSLGGTAGTGGGSGSGTPTSGKGGGGGASAFNDGANAGGGAQNTPNSGSNGNDGIGFGRAFAGSGGGVTTVAAADPKSWGGLGYGGYSPKLSSVIAGYIGRFGLIPGAGGGGGSEGQNVAGGAGGRGAGAMYIECAGTYTFTSGTILGTGDNGTNGGSGNASGGGGGGGGCFIVQYLTLGADSGTYTFTGGTGGSASGSGGAGGAGGDGAAIRFQKSI